MNDLTTAIIYADPNTDEELEGTRMNYFYMHGQAEARTGYDCCNGNAEALRKALKQGVFLATLILPDGAEEMALVSSTFRHGQMEGFVAILSDLDAVKYALKRFKGFPSIYEHQLQYLKQTNEEVMDLLRDCSKNH